MAAKSASKSGKSKKPSAGKATTATARKSAKASTSTTPTAKPKKSKSAAASNGAQTTKPSNGYYVIIDRAQLRIATAKPAAAEHVEQAADFCGAKDKAIDLLIERIESLEQQLWALKQASDCDDFASRTAAS